MIPRLPAPEPTQTAYVRFLDELRASAFGGEIATDYASRIVTATDNSVYQILPQAVVYPRTREDVATFAKLAAQPKHRSITFSPRGGGTGTNGQSLSDGIIVDVSRHMRRVLEINLQAGWVRVEPGVVLDQLNAELRAHGVFFAPTLSPSNRATLGGMISTDACGKGSRIYGRTSNHVLELELVFLDGSTHVSTPVDRVALEKLRTQPDAVGRAYDVAARVVDDKRTVIAEQFPRLKRFLTGYNLAHASEAPYETFDLNPIICGSEGTLAFVTAAKLRLTPLPAHKTLVVVKYASFDDALAAAQELVELDPGAIETIDDTILSLAREDVIWPRVEPLLRDNDPHCTTATISLVEFESHNADIVHDKVQRLLATVAAEAGQPRRAIGAYVAKTQAEATALWDLRKKGVGLLGNAEGARRPIAFVEDTAVPPERLADYIRDFRGLLESAGLRYGMFGHVDVGCLHVRPALDMRDPEDEKLLRKLSDQVVELVARYGGVMWSEHGKGFRSEYSPRFFGAELYEALCEIKKAFDPHNQLNPGKLATPAGSGAKLVTIDAQKRGAFDRHIHPRSQEQYAVALNCNGNGACFNYSPDAVMCPSSKVTRDRMHSPKGRAGLLREWLRQLSQAGVDATSPPARREPSWWGKLVRWFRSTSPARRSDDFSHQVYDAMHGCLACKACATECPIHVDVPRFRAEFLELYHTRYRHPLRDRFMATLEPSAAMMARAPRLFNALVGWAPVAAFLRYVVGIVDTPALSKLSVKRGLRQRGIPMLDPRQPTLTPSEAGPAIVVVQDAFTSFYDPQVLFAFCELAQGLGFRPHVLPFMENGKGRHVKGYLRAFHRVAKRGAAVLTRVAKLDVPIVGLDPAVVLTYRDEYRVALGTDRGDFEVMLPQEWLFAVRERLEAYAHTDGPTYTLLGHCTERTAVTRSGRLWSDVFAACGLRATDVAVGCCGMCGAYGHERDHQDESRGIYAMSWQPRLVHSDPARVVVPGFSCRSQIKRVDGVRARHPVEILRDHVCAAKTASNATATAPTTAYSRAAYSKTAFLAEPGALRQ